MPFKVIVLAHKSAKADSRVRRFQVSDLTYTSISRSTFIEATILGVDVNPTV